MTTTRQVYTNTVKSRQTSSEIIRGVSLPVRSLANQRTPACQQSHSHPSTSQLREARVNRFQASYDGDKELFKIKEKEKQEIKLKDKLKRYKGVGELGQKLSDVHITDDEIREEYRRSRASYQHSHNAEVKVLNLKREEEAKAIDLKKLEQMQQAEGGQKLGGSKEFSRARGDHPLLARFSHSN